MLHSGCTGSQLLCCAMGRCPDETGVVILKCSQNLCLEFLLFEGSSHLEETNIWLHFGCGPTPGGRMMALGRGLLHLLDESSLSLVYSICFSVCIKQSLSLFFPSLAHRLGCSSGIVHMPGKEFGCDILLGHYSSSWHFICRGWRCLAALVRTRSGDSGSTEFTQ